MVMGRKLYNGMDAFNEGAAASQKMFDSISRRKLNEGNLGVAQGNLAVSQQAENRQQSMLPYLMEAAKDAHLMSPLQRQHLSAQIKESLANTGKTESDTHFNNMIDRMMMGNGEGGGTPSSPQEQQATPEQQSIGAPQAVPNEEASDEVRAPVANPSAIPAKDVIAMANQDQQKYDMAHPQNPMNAQQQAPIPTSPVQPNAPTVPQPQVPPVSAPTDEYAEKVIKPATPGREFLDKLAGLDAHGRRFEKPQVLPPVDGMQQTIWPSGKITMKKVGSTDQEKEQMKSNVKEAGEVEKSMPDILGSINNMAEIGDTITNNPGLTGIKNILPLRGSFAGEQYGTLQTRINAARGDIARSLTGKNTGAKSLLMAGMQKPDVMNSDSTNMGMVRANLEIAKNKYDQFISSWQRANPGKQIPKEWKFPEKAEKILSNKGSEQQPGNAPAAENAPGIIINGYEHKMLNGKLHRRKV